MKPKIIALLQARCSSSRFPQKVLADLVGKPLIARVIERIQRSAQIEDLVLATSTDPSDQELLEWGQRAGISVFAGSLNDVLERFCGAIDDWQDRTGEELVDQDRVVRLTADCPLIDPEVIDQTIQFHLDSVADYTSNVLKPSFPDGCDVEVMRLGALRAARQEARLASDREHVTPFIWRQPDRFRLSNYDNPRGDQSALRWTVDYPDDLKFVAQVYARLYSTNSKFGMDEVLELLEREPGLKNLAQAAERNEGYQKSIEEDASHG